MINSSAEDVPLGFTIGDFNNDILSQSIFCFIILLLLHKDMLPGTTRVDECYLILFLVLISLLFVLPISP